MWLGGSGAHLEFCAAGLPKVLEDGGADTGDIRHQLTVHGLSARGGPREVLLEQSQEPGAICIADPNRCLFRRMLTALGDGQQQPLRLLGGLAVPCEPFEGLDPQRERGIGPLQHDDRPGRAELFIKSGLSAPRIMVSEGGIRLADQSVAMCAVLDGADLRVPAAAGTSKRTVLCSIANPQVGEIRWGRISQRSQPPARPTLRRDRRR